MINTETINEIRIDGTSVYVEPGSFTIHDPEWGAWSKPTLFTAYLAGSERQIQGRMDRIQAVLHVAVAPVVDATTQELHDQGFGLEVPTPGSPFQIEDRVQHVLTLKRGTIQGRKIPSSTLGQETRFPNEVCVWFDGQHPGLAQWLPASQFTLIQNDVPETRS